MYSHSVKLLLAEHLFELSPIDPVPYVLISNIIPQLVDGMAFEKFNK